MSPAPKPRLGVSACLLGQPVRYDGGHKRHRLIAELLPQHFELVAVCPEHDCGLGVPREPMHLHGDVEAPRLLCNDTARDLSAQMRAWCERRVGELRSLDLVGFVGKARSPSCGLDVPVSQGDGRVSARVLGLWMACLRQRAPSWLLVDESTLHDEPACLALIDKLLA